MDISVVRRVTHVHKQVSTDYPDSPTTDIMLTHHRLFEEAAKAFKAKFGKYPNYAEVTVKYDVYLGLMQLELIEEIEPD
jgi:hypothetical protein